MPKFDIEKFYPIHAVKSNPYFNNDFYKISKNLDLESLRKSLMSQLSKQYVSNTYPGMDALTRVVFETKLVNIFSSAYGITPTNIESLDPDLLKLIDMNYLRQFELFLTYQITPSFFLNHWFEQNDYSLDYKIKLIDYLRKNYLNHDQSTRTIIDISNKDEVVKLIFDSWFFLVLLNDKPQPFDKKYFKHWAVPNTATVEFGIYVNLLLKSCLSMEDISLYIPDPSRELVLKWIKALSLDKLFVSDCSSKNRLEKALINKLSTGGTLLSLLADDFKNITIIKQLCEDQLLQAEHFNTKTYYGVITQVTPVWQLVHHLYHSSFPNPYHHIESSYSNKKSVLELITLLTTLLKKGLLTSTNQTPQVKEKLQFDAHYRCGQSINDMLYTFLSAYHSENSNDFIMLYTNLMVFTRLLQDKNSYRLFSEYAYYDNYEDLMKDMRNVKHEESGYVIIKSKGWCCFYPPVKYHATLSIFNDAPAPRPALKKGDPEQERLLMKRPI